MPGPVGINGQQMRYDEAVAYAILTFRDADGVRWIRLADGTLQEQDRPTTRESILTALGRPWGDTIPAMTERKHDLPTAYERLDNQITGPVADAIAVRPRSRGQVSMPGEWNTDSRPTAHEVKITSTDPGNEGVDTEERLLGSPERYRITYDIWNHRDSPSFAQIVLTDPADQEQADTPRGEGERPRT